MPFELGLDLGSKKYGNQKLKLKRILILDSIEHQYLETISDIRGQDPVIHDNDPDKAFNIVRDWLKISSGRKTIPGPQEIRKIYLNITNVLPDYCREIGYEPHELPFFEYVEFVKDWVSIS